jgi:hypothetical protein
MHQPLHLCGRDRGGNSDKVHWDNRVTSACAFWDFHSSAAFPDSRRAPAGVYFVNKRPSLSLG